jgi:tRNA G37 N-methylase TrmD
MFRVDIITLFPDMFKGPFDMSMLWKAQDRGLLQIKFWDLRQFGLGTRRTVDDTPYEGFDERIMSYVDDQLSIGDYVLTGGELPAMVIVDSVARLIPGVLGGELSAHDESFSEARLVEYPHFTRPEEFRGDRVPEVLLNGHHAEIARWRQAQAMEKTRAFRPDLQP